MSTITIDPSLSEKLRILVQPVVLCDESGRVLGRYIPDARPETSQPQIGDEEMARRKQEGGGRTLDAILRDLEGRA